MPSRQGSIDPPETSNQAPGDVRLSGLTLMRGDERTTGRSCTNRRSSLTPVTGRSRSTEMEEYPVPKSSRWMPTPSPRRDVRACRAESTRLRVAVSVTSITIRSGSTRCRLRVSKTPLSQSGAASWTAETLTLIGPGRSGRFASGEQTRSRTWAPMAVISPLSSATSRKSPGLRRPRVG